MYRPLALLLLAISCAAPLAVSGAETSPLPTAPRKVRVAVYVDAGASGGAKQVLEVLEGFPAVQVARVTADDIRDGRLVRSDVLLLPGGSGGGEGKALGEEGRRRIRDFVRAGGGYLGICAGSYLATPDYPWSLGILKAHVLDKAHWARGNGDVEIDITPAGKLLLGAHTSRTTIPYFQGPLLAPAESPDLPDYEPLAHFATEIAEKGAPRGVMIGTTAAAAAPFGAGRVCCFSPHPEKLRDTYPLLLRAVLWTAKMDTPER